MREASPDPKARLAGLLDRIADDSISGKIAKDVLDIMMESGMDAGTIIEEKGLKQALTPVRLMP